MKKIPKAVIVVFQKRILSWYAENRRDLPWRPPSLKLRKDGQPDPYLILVSEVMLQQTQVSRVIPKYEAWLDRFPSVGDLAKASTKEVLQLWSGLGYNRRALNLQKAAKMICLSSRPPSRDPEEDLDSRLLASLKLWRSGRGNDDVIFPRTIEDLKKLPGVGEYTARAILCFAFNEQVAVVDTNVRKVILIEFKEEILKQVQNDNTRLLHPKGFAMTDKEIQKIAYQLLPKGKARDWNQALMDYAALVLKDQKVMLRKQSAFKGSRRYFRGKLLKILLRDGAIEIVSIRKILAEDAFPVSDAWLFEIVREMESDGFVRCNKTKIYLRS